MAHDARTEEEDFASQNAFRSDRSTVPPEHPQAHIVPSSEGATVTSIIKFVDESLSAHKRLTGGIMFTKVVLKSPSGKILTCLIKDPHFKTPMGRPRL
jgi:hypothetical protein